MHRSKLAGLIIDCQTADLPAAARFWSEALGWAGKPKGPADGDRYVELTDPHGSVHVEVQKVTHPSRVHLDIETDDVEAEVERLEALGAKRVQQVKTWWVMEAPTGQRFCVVRVQNGDFEARARVWA
jgi:predicted enzyme related to lactoylglutathione lyase